MINKHPSKGDNYGLGCGQHQMFTCHAKFNTHSKSNVTSGGLGTMGFASSRSHRSEDGMPDREVVAIS
jgi:acetolactate synthase-1/2/3 large subunit